MYNYPYRHFFVSGYGRTADEAFSSVLNQKRLFDIPEIFEQKKTFAMLECPEGDEPFLFAMRLLTTLDRRVQNVFGPVSCIKLQLPVTLGDDGTYFHYIFFGWTEK